MGFVGTQTVVLPIRGPRRKLAEGGRKSADEMYQLLSKILVRAERLARMIPASAVLVEVVSTVEMKRVVVERGQLFSPAPGSGSIPEPIKTEERYNIRMDVDREFMKLYEEALAISGGPMIEVFRSALKVFCEKRSPIRREKMREDKNNSRLQLTAM